MDSREHVTKQDLATTNGKERRVSKKIEKIGEEGIEKN